MNTTSPNLTRYYAFFAAVALVGIAAGIYDTAMNAGRDHDSKVETDMMTLSNGVNLYQSSNRVLPTSLDQTSSTGGYATTLKSSLNLPLSTYDYKTTGLKTYDICADFRYSTLNSSAAHNQYTPAGQIHDKGHVCIHFTNTDYILPAPPSPTPAPTAVLYTQTNQISDACTIAANCKEATTGLTIATLYGGGNALGLRATTSRTMRLDWDSAHTPVFQDPTGKVINYQALKLGQLVDIRYSGNSLQPVGTIAVK